MPKRNRNKNRNKNEETIDPVAHAKVIKAGVYDGRFASTDFVVSGHSTGSPHTEMEALSHQVSRDAGVVPAYETDDNYRLQKRRTDLGDKGPEENRGAKDLGGPILYGPNPSFLRESPLGQNPSRRRNSIFGAAALALAGIIGLLAYKSYRGRGTGAVA